MELLYVRTPWTWVTLEPRPEFHEHHGLLFRIADEEDPHCDVNGLPRRDPLQASLLKRRTFTK